MDKVRANEQALRSLVSNYHPSSRNRSGKRMPITAPGAEAACETIREQIKQEEPINPVESFNKALNNNDPHTIYRLLDSAWFGVPESTQCWEIEGFSVAVDLLDDPPEVDDVEA
jgi:hypothetical protein